MHYSLSRPFRGDLEKSFDLAETALTALGFRYIERTAHSVEMSGPGMNSTRESALMGASRIHITSRSSEIVLDADLGGVQRMARFATFFPSGLSLSVGLLLYAVFSGLWGPGAWIPIVGIVTVGNAVIWLFLGPLLARSIRERTCRGLDTLLDNMVFVGEEPPEVRR